MKKISIIIPVFNEEATVESLLSKVLAVNFGKWKSEIIIVDDGSTDNTKPSLRESASWRRRGNLKVFSHKINQGKGAAIQTGLKHITGNAVIVQDADLEYDPQDIPKLLKEFDKNKSQIIFGSRDLKLKEQILYVWGINFSTKLINLLYGASLTDLYTCYKLYDARALASVNSNAHGFEWDIDIIVKLLKKGYKVSEVPISYHPRNFMEGKKIKPWDGIIGIWIIIKNRFYLSSRT